MLAVEALEREVNNGGYSQFFANASNQFAGSIVEPARIDCARTAEITQQATLRSGWKRRSPPRARSGHRRGRGGAARLAKCDDRYFDGKRIADRLFEWIGRNRTRSAPPG